MGQNWRSKLDAFIKNRELLMEEKISVKRRRRKQKHMHRLSWKGVLEALEYGG